MTDEPDLRKRARRALERSLRSDASPPDEPADPELLARIEVALRTLPRRRRAIFLAVCRDDASYAALAEQTGLSIKQVEREVAAALVQIDRALHDRRPDPWWRRVWHSLSRR
jgi:RNA polymerase sigma-70 factor (ECF subfamily)